VSQSDPERRYCCVNGPHEVAAELPGDAQVRDADFDLEAVFLRQYQRIAGVIARVVRHPARAEELAVEVFLKLSQNPPARGDGAQDQMLEAWLYRAAVRIGLDELRRQTRRQRYENLAGFFGLAAAPTPEELHSAAEERDKVRRVLSSMVVRQAELLLLRSHGLSYEELSAALHLHPASVGTLLSRAQNAFRKEYIKRYGQQ